MIQSLFYDQCAIFKGQPRTHGWRFQKNPPEVIITATCWSVMIMLKQRTEQEVQRRIVQQQLGIYRLQNCKNNFSGKCVGILKICRLVQQICSLLINRWHQCSAIISDICGTNVLHCDSRSEFGTEAGEMGNGLSRPYKGNKRKCEMTEW